MSTQQSSSTSTEGSAESQTATAANFGPNEWLVDDMYQKYLEDPDSVDSAWHEFFADYKPAPSDTEATSNGAATQGTAAASPTITASTATASNGGNGAHIAATTSAPAKTSPAQTAPKPATTATPPAGETHTTKLRGSAARIVANMDASLAVPTATSVRAVPAKLLADNRIVINNHLKRTRSGKVSFTHLIGYALAKAVAEFPEMNHSFTVVDGKPALATPEHVNIGLAIDLKAANGSRSLVVASIKAAETMNFSQFLAAYEDIVRKARHNKLTADDFAGTTISLTNPGTIGTVHSVPRLMRGQGTIVGVGAMEYPAEYSGMSEDALAELGISKTITLTSTYDHRIIQGAQSGEFLKRMHQLLLGEDGFYDEIFTSLRLPYEPIRWTRDVAVHGDGAIDKNARVQELINAYRVGGHLMADTDPLEYQQRRHPDLDILQHGLTLWDLDRYFPVGGFGGKHRMKLRDILGVLRDSYCRRVGVEYMHITDPEERAWIQQRVEVKHENPSADEQKQILAKLNAAEAFETFLHTKYVGQKRFSLEGGEAVIPLLDEVIEAAAEDSLDETVIGMAHRGRLNVLANVVGKPYEKIFGEFEGNISPATTHGSGDVKYHLGAESRVTTPDGKQITVSLTSNPSHLEAVDPVVEGIARAKQDLIDKGERGFTVLPILIHGDASMAGQGVVAETLNLSQLRGYRTGGTVHVVINNQVGFTTAPEYSRSTVYCTDIARTVQAPIFHVNGDDPEACVQVARLAFEYRQAFNKDVVIDMVCYRRRGHNEGDDPSMTNPQMYAIIDTKRSVRKLYTEALVARGDLTLEEAEAALRDFQERLEHVFRVTKDARSEPHVPARIQAPSADKVDTAISLDMVHRIGDAHVSWPEGFTPHPRIKPQMEKRQKMSREGNIDWGFGEILAFGSLVAEGKAVRLAGQDSRRGTFVQRHSVIFDHASGEEYTPLNNVNTADSSPARFWVYDSLLSEFAAMGFEYGYSLANPEALVVWEAQFGDFANGAQSVVDEFISSGEAKWGQKSGVVLLLPHGYEGQGPDHSSGRIERHLQLCAEDNMTVANCTTPANYFHLLRQQALSPEHRPLVVFTPKSLLRHKLAVSPVEDFTSGGFQPVLSDPGIGGQPLDPANVRRVLFCSGKVYYDLLTAREQRGITDAAIVRIEQLFPLPIAEVNATLARYPNAVDHVWVQEEPANQGAWSFIALNLLEHLEGVRLRRISRRAAASPAVGSHKVHELEQASLVEAALPQSQ